MSVLSIKSAVFARQVDPFYLRLLAKNGINAICVDFLDIKFESKEVIEQQLLPYQHIPFVFTSSNAVKAVHQIDFKSTPKAFVIKGNTRKLADLAGFEILGEAENSEALAHVIVSKKIEKIVHLSTASRIEAFETVLLQNEIEYACVEVYKKEKNPQIVSGFDAIVFYSPSQVDAFLTFNTFNPRMHAFCIGKTTGNYLKNKGLVRVIVSPKPSTEHIVSTIIAFKNK